MYDKNTLFSLYVVCCRNIYLLLPLSCFVADADVYNKVDVDGNGNGTGAGLNIACVFLSLNCLYFD